RGEEHSGRGQNGNEAHVEGDRRRGPRWDSPLPASRQRGCDGPTSDLTGVGGVRMRSLTTFVAGGARPKDTRAAVQAVLSGPDRPFGVRLWDGTVLPSAAVDGQPVLVLVRPQAGAAFGIPPSEERLSEAFLAGDLEVEGNLVDFLERTSRWKGPQHLPTAAVATGLVAEVGARATGFFRAGGKHSVSRDAGAVRSHYDLGNDFYRLFLDARMVYSCAYWAPGVETLEGAQLAKLELVCRKLGLQRDQRLLDIGCGWGALVSHATRAFGARATGITLSPPQRELALDALRGASPPGAPIDIRLTDYRQLPADERWDRVASVGMMEHVGRENLGQYF